MESRPREMKLLSVLSVDGKPEIKRIRERTQYSYTAAT